MPLTLVCQHCGNLFTQTNYNTNRPHKGKYCSVECRTQSMTPSINRLAQRVRIDPQTGCHIWMGALVRTGYGHAKHNGKIRYTHRIMWEHKNGPVPEGMQLDHLCNVRACCNPEHLRVCTPRENTLAGNNMAARHARKLVCPKCSGPYSFHPSGRRYCAPCKKKHDAEYHKGRPVNLEKQREATRRYRQRMKDRSKPAIEIPPTA